MKRFYLIVFIFPLIISLFSSVATICPAGESSWKCGTEIVEIGDPKIVVSSSCGEPLSKEEIGYTLTKDQKRELKIEQWVYGPRYGYYTLLTFEGGRLVKIEEAKE